MIANSGRITKEKPSFKEKITNFFQYKFGSFTSTKYPITPETLGKTAPKCGVCLSLAIILGINAKKYSKRTQEEEVSEVNLSFNPHSLKLDEHLENRILPEGRNHISNQQENSNSDTMEHEIDGIYSPVMNLTQKIAGTRIQRS